MINVHDNYWIPSSEYKYISNGEIWTDGIYLGKGADINDWADTNDDPPDPQEPGEKANAEDYEAALNRLGVEI